MLDVNMFATYRVANFMIRQVDSTLVVAIDYQSTVRSVKLAQKSSPPHGLLCRCRQTHVFRFGCRMHNGRLPLRIPANIANTLHESLPAHRPSCIEIVTPVYVAVAVKTRLFGPRVP